MMKPSEFQILVLAVALAPLMIWAYRGIAMRGKKWLAAALLAMAGAYIFTVLEGFFAYTLFNTFEHICYAIAGGCFAVTCLNLLKMNEEAGSS